MFISILCGLYWQTRTSTSPTYQIVPSTKWILCTRRPFSINGNCTHHFLFDNFPTSFFQVCDKFYFCVDGVPNPITCPASLIFDPDRVRDNCFSATHMIKKIDILSQQCTFSGFFRVNVPTLTRWFARVVPQRRFSSSNVQRSRTPNMNILDILTLMVYHIKCIPFQIIID